jgi:galacturan 1,4-alpha-galacturonidase
MLFTKLVALGSSLSLAPAVVIAAAAAVSERATTPCTLTAAGAGKDDAPSLVSAMQSCATVTVAAGTTLNISSKMNMTGLSNRHLVSERSVLRPYPSSLFSRACKAL